MFCHILLCVINFLISIIISVQVTFPKLNFLAVTFVDFTFMIFTQVLMKEIARMLIHVRKIHVFQNTVVNVPHTFWERTLNIATYEKIITTVTEVILIQASFLTIGSKQKIKNELTECQDISILFKSQVYLKQENQIFCCLGKVNVFSDNSDLADLVRVQRWNGYSKWFMLF